MIGEADFKRLLARRAPRLPSLGRVGERGSQAALDVLVERVGRVLDALAQRPRRRSRSWRRPEGSPSGASGTSGRCSGSASHDLLGVDLHDLLALPRRRLQDVVLLPDLGVPAAEQLLLAVDRDRLRPALRRTASRRGGRRRTGVVSFVGPTKSRSGSRPSGAWVPHQRRPSAVTAMRSLRWQGSPALRDPRAGGRAPARAAPRRLRLDRLLLVAHTIRRPVAPWWTGTPSAFATRERLRLELSIPAR